MAGHSHWSQIKRAKGANDAKRGQIFSRLAREITMATRLGGSDPSFNPRLRQAITTAKSESMPTDTIERAIKKGTGELAGGQLEEMLYEGYGPGGVAILVEATTDNKNRSAAEIRSLFSKNGGNLAGSGSVSWMFSHKGLIQIPADQTSEDAVMIPALDAGAEDIRTSGEFVEVVTSIDKLYSVDDALRKNSLPVKESRFFYTPSNLTPIADPSVASELLELITLLEEHDDASAVYTNADIPSDLIPPPTT